MIDVRCGLGTATALLMKNRIGEIHACIAFSAFSLSVPLLHKLSIHLKTIFSNTTFDMTRGDNKENLLFTCDLCMSLFMTRFVTFVMLTCIKRLS